MKTSKSRQKRRGIGGGKLAYVVCPNPECNAEFEWSRNLETSISVLLYMKKRQRFSQILGKLGGTKSGTVWALRDLRRRLHFTGRKRDEDGKLYHYLRPKGRKAVEDFLQSVEWH